MSRGTGKLRRCQAILALLVFAWHSEGFGVCVMGNCGVEGHDAVVGTAYPGSDSRGRAVVGGARDHDQQHAPFHCCSTGGTCTPTAVAQAPTVDPAVWVVSLVGAQRSLEVSVLIPLRTPPPAHGPPAYLRFATLLI
jgi:hypothetical protein